MSGCDSQSAAAYIYCRIYLSYFQEEEEISNFHLICYTEATKTSSKLLLPVGQTFEKKTRLFVSQDTRVRGRSPSFC